VRDDLGWVRRLEKVEEGLSLLERSTEHLRRWIVWLLQNIENVGVDVDGNPPQPECPAGYLIHSIVSPDCGHLDEVPTYSATLTGPGPTTIDTWTATPGAVHANTVDDPGTYTLSVVVDNDVRGPSTYTSTVTILPKQCFRVIVVRPCYTTMIGLRVYGCHCLPLPGATVTLAGDMTAAFTTDANGYVIEPYTGEEDSPDITFTITKDRFQTLVLPTMAPPCCTTGPASTVEPNACTAINGSRYGPLLLPDDNHICGCDPDCPEPVPRAFLLTTDKGTCTLTWDEVGPWPELGIFPGWTGTLTWDETEGGQITLFPGNWGLGIPDRYCCVKTTKTINARVWMFCCERTDTYGNRYYGYCLAIAPGGICGTIVPPAPGSFCALQAGVRAERRLSGTPLPGETWTFFEFDGQHLHPCGDVFDAEFNFVTTGTTLPPELTMTAVVTELP
jgi:hypothetical protein